MFITDTVLQTVLAPRAWQVLCLLLMISRVKLVQVIGGETRGPVLNNYWLSCEWS